MPISCHFRDCKARVVTSSRVSSAIASTRPLPFLHYHTEHQHSSQQTVHYSGRREATQQQTDQRTPGKRSGERYVDSRFQVQLEKDGGGSTRHSWMEGYPGLSNVPLEATRHKPCKSKLKLTKTVYCITYL